MNWTEYLRIEKRKDFNKSEDDIYLDYYNKYLCSEDFENEILDEIEYEAKLDNLENDKARDKKKYHKEYYLKNKKHLKEYQISYGKEYREKNKEELKVKRIEFYKKNKEKFKEINKQRYLKYKEKRKEYREKNKEKFKEYREKNKEELKVKRIEYRKQYKLKKKYLILVDNKKHTFFNIT